MITSHLKEVHETDFDTIGLKNPFFNMVITSLLCLTSSLISFADNVKSTSILGIISGIYSLSVGLGLLQFVYLLVK